MIKLYLITITILLTALTIAVGIIKPEVNRPVRFAVSDFRITNTELAQDEDATHKPPAITNKIVNTDLTQNKIIEKVIDTSSPATKQKTQVVENKENKITKTVEVQKQQQNIKKTTKTVTNETSQNSSKTVTQKSATQINGEKNVKIPQSVKDIVNNQNTQQTQQTAPRENKTVKLPQIDPTPKPVEVQKTIEQVPVNERPLTEQEEIIVWNIWRSNLQNQIMKDTEISAPIGTAFKFSFTVDKKGRISNLRTWTVPSTYNGIAVNYLRPLILSYQGQTILNFPSKTKRVITNVTGGFVISTQDRFSTPNDFSDIEKVKTLR